MNIQLRTRPKGYNTKVWLVMYEEAEANKAWVKDICLNKPEWFKQASEMSLQMLGNYLASHAKDLAKEAYDYLEMRAHGQTFLGALDSSARERWESITGRKIGVKKMWHYDHTKNITAAKRDGKKWVSWLNGKQTVSYKEAA